VLADISDHLGHTEDGLQALAEAHTRVEQHEEHRGKQKSLASGASCSCDSRGAHALLSPIYDWFTEGFDTASGGSCITLAR
jgi:hypothetical protein